MSAMKEDEGKSSVGSTMSRRDFARVSALGAGAALIVTYAPAALSSPIDAEALRQSAIFTMGQ